MNLDYGTLKLPLWPNLEWEITLGADRDFSDVWREIEYQAELAGGWICQGPPRRMEHPGGWVVWEYPMARPGHLSDCYGFADGWGCEPDCPIGNKRGVGR